MKKIVLFLIFSAVAAGSAIAQEAPAAISLQEAMPA